MASRYPLSEVQHESGRIATLGDTENYPQRIEHLARMYERHSGRGQTPDERNEEEPATHADPLQEPQARQLDDDVADEEQADADAVGLCSEAQRFIHLQRGKAHVGAIDGAEEQQQQQGRHQTHANPADDLICVDCQRSPGEHAFVPFTLRLSKGSSRGKNHEARSFRQAQRERSSIADSRHRGVFQETTSVAPSISAAYDRASHFRGGVGNG